MGPMSGPTTVDAVERAPVARAPRPPVRRIALALAALALAGLIPPLFMSDYWLKVSQAVVIYTVVAGGAGLLYGRVGLVSLCQIALLGVGGWMALRIYYATGLPLPFVLVGAGLATAFVGVAVGLPALRLSGLHLALVTLMAAGAVTLVLKTTHFPNGGTDLLGVVKDTSSVRIMPRPEIAETQGAFYVYCVVVAALLMGLALWHLRSRPGRAWAAIRQSEALALASGVNVTLYKLWAFALASFVTGVAGGLLAASTGQLSYFQFPTQDSVVLLAVILIGGVHSLGGAVVAGVFMQAVPAILDRIGLDPTVVLILFGVGVIQTLLTAPRGIYGQLEDMAAAIARRLGRPVEAGS
jgi:branched-chain amino acid transport system permease protein